MKVALDRGEVLDIALIEDERIIGTLSIELKGLVSAARGAGRPAGSSRSTASESETRETSGKKTRKKRKPMSEEARARMAAAQRRRWENKKGNEGSSAE